MKFMTVAAPPSSGKILAMINLIKLLKPRFKGKILAINEMTPPASLLKLFYVHHFKDAGREFIEKNLTYKGLPVEVNRAVEKG